MKVERWTNNSDTALVPEKNLGSLGGWFNMHTRGQRWQDYLSIWKPEFHPHFEAIREEILRLQLKRGGFWHQEQDGIPVLSDGHHFSASMRAWGDLLAAVWSEADNKDHSYCEFAWSGTDDD